MKTVGIFVKPDAKTVSKAEELTRWLEARGVQVVLQQSTPPARKPDHQGPDAAPAGLDSILVLGGDGTFLSAVRWIGGQDIPILGVKFGEVGFLAETAEGSLYTAVEAVLNHDFTTSRRMRLDVSVRRDGKPLARETVLNDVVINKGALARLARIKTYVDDHYLTTYRADGLILATPTGSTAYNLAAGGPVIHPEVPGIIMTPICPFTLTNRPLIVPETIRITIRLEKGSSDIMLTFDGQEGFEITENDTITVTRSPHDIRMITMPGVDYFNVLKAKLRWSGGRI